MSAKHKKLAPKVDEATPELKALLAQFSLAQFSLAQFSEQDVETGVVARSTDAPVPTRRYDASDVQSRFVAALLERSLSHLLRSARSTAGLSLADVAERLCVSRSWIQQLEKEGANLQIDTLRRVADALGYDVHVSFVARDEDKPSLTAPLG